MERPLVLVVDDDKYIRDLVELSLRSNFEVRTVGNGEEALALIQETVPDLLVLDIMMPELDGFTLCTLLREDPKTSTLPILALTAKNKFEDLEEGFRVGVDDYMTKPFSIAELRQHVARFFP